MLERIIRYVRGYCVCTVEARAEDVMNGLFSIGLSYWNIRHQKGRITFRFMPGERKKVADLLDKIPSAVYIIYDRGIPTVIRRYRHRYGIAAGAVLFCLSLWFSSLFIWDVRITGNEVLSESYIRACLAQFGCKTGAFYPSLNLYELTTEYLEQYDDLCWLSVNMKGNIANVEVRESQRKPERDPNTTPANIVSAYSGVVTAVYVYAGEPAVKTGDSVTQGQLLISGFYQDRYEHISLVRAAGQVLIQTQKTVTVQVPYIDERTELTGNTVTYRTARAFGMTLPLYWNRQDLSDGYQYVSIEEPLWLFDGIRTPVLVTTEEYAECRTVTFERTTEQAHAEALRRMEECLRTETAGCDILQTVPYVYDSVDEKGRNCYTLRYEMTCVADAAVVRDITMPNQH